MSTGTILLHPRPFAQSSGSLLLLPLLPHKPPLKPLPSEIWSKIFDMVRKDCPTIHDAPLYFLNLLTVCKCFKDMALPILYSCARMGSIHALRKFYAHLRSADQKWDSIRRIPYSTPGRWVQALDLSRLAFTSQEDAMLYDSILSDLFPLLPFLASLGLNPVFALSRRTLKSLASREGILNVRVLEGFSFREYDQGPFFDLLRRCKNLEQLEVIGQGYPLDSEFEFSFETADPVPSLELPRLHTLTLLSMPSSSLMLSLRNSPLPSLRKLMITPYEDLPESLVSSFIATHGELLRSLLLYMPKSGPTIFHPSPNTILHTCPNLTHLSLELPLPRLTVPSPDTLHPLRILSIPRPRSDFWDVLEPLLPNLPSLKIVHARDMRWLRKGMAPRAQNAGVQGDLREWRRRLARRQIRVLDSDWRECD